MNAENSLSESPELHENFGAVLFLFPVPQRENGADFGPGAAERVKQALEATLEKEVLLLKHPQVPSITVLPIEDAVGGIVFVTNTNRTLPIVRTELIFLNLEDGAEIGHYDFLANTVYTYFPDYCEAGFRGVGVLVAKIMELLPPELRPPPPKP